MPRGEAFVSDMPRMNVTLHSHCRIKIESWCVKVPPKEANKPTRGREDFWSHE
jgi:hypothetical protein